MALASLTACKKKKSKEPPPVAVNVAGGVGADDEGDVNGDDGDRGAPVKAASAANDAADNKAAIARIQGKALGDPAAAAKKVGAPSVVVKKDKKGGCGEITVGKNKVKLDCDSESYGVVKNASSSIIKEDDIGGAPGAAAVKLPDVVDFRAKNLIGPVLNQGNALSCTAVSLAAVINHELAVEGKPGSVSPMHIWARYANPSMDEAINTNEGKPIIPASLLPYDWKVADKWDKAQPPPKDLVSKLDTQAIVKLVDVEQIGLKDIKGTLAQGHAVWFALAGAHFINKTDGPPGGEQIIPAYDWKNAPADQRMSHALAFMGYRVINGKTFYLIQNSWGTEWGANGFAYIDENTLQKNFKFAYVIDVEPIGGAKPSSAVGALPPTKCKPGLLPDAVTGKCAAKCPDGSARNDGTCAETDAACGQGEVNVKGKCVRAAPTMKIKKEGFAVNCVAGGCLYGFAKGVAGCPRDNGCVVACAAPRFKLVKTASGIRCH